ncbi:NCKX3 protein, partial [Amia calva]|nr:NCKX3 protein [Amia calva]
MLLRRAWTVCQSYCVNKPLSLSFSLSLSQAVYMFYALAIVCDDYFVPSLEKISEVRASHCWASAETPELFTSLIGVFITKGDVGVGTIVGSAVFNILVIIGICGVFAGQTVPLTWWSLFRDSTYYTFSVLALILVIYDEKVTWWESIILISMYGVYIIIMKFNTQIHNFLEQQRPGGGTPRLVNGRQREVPGGEGPHSNTSMVLLRKAGHPGQEGPVLMVDELFRLHARPLSFPEASLRIMITQHFSPRTRLSMAGRMLINEVPAPVRAGLHWARESRWEIYIPGRSAHLGLKHIVNVNATGLRRNRCQGSRAQWCGHCERVKWAVSWPLALLLYCTVPNCVLPRWQRWFMATFLMSTLWIAIFSYLMVWMVTIISYTLGIPDVIMGITFLAAGTSVPDCMASLIVARQGMGDMAVSNSIGSNVFDILLGLGFPWALQTLLVDYGSSVFINSKGLLYSVILLLASVFLTVLSVHLNHWKLDRKLGLGVLSLYAVFLLCSILIELNVIANLPACL